MRSRAALLILTVLAALGVIYLAGCSKVDAPPAAKPLAPETQLTYAPIDFDTTTFRVHFYWNGTDKDGEVVAFHYAIDAQDTLPIPEWPTTTAKDTTFLFLVDPVAQLKLHTFKISAQDNEGNIDPTPATRSFSAKTLPPTSEITKGPAAFNPIVGPNFTFEWTGIDPDGGETGGRAPVDSFEYLLLLLGSVQEADHDPLPFFNQAAYVKMVNDAVNDHLLVYAPGDPANGPVTPGRYDDWHWVGIHAIRNRFRNATPGEYVFAERAVDLAGATEKNLAFGRNIRHFTVSTRNPGPVLTIRSSVLVTALSPTSGPEDAPRKALQIFEGETISFSWTASADAYGGEVVGYTYALDDTSRFPGLDLLTTGATFQPSVLPPGSHFLFVRAVDDGGLVTNAVIPLLIIHPSFKDAGAPHQVLYVDDSTPPSTAPPGTQPPPVGSYPSDGVESNWWNLFLLPNLGVPFSEWDAVDAGRDLDGRKPPEPRDLANVTTVVWNTDYNNPAGQGNALWKTLVGGSYSELAGYLRAGGTMVLTGFQLAANTANPGTTMYANRSRGICFGLDPGTVVYLQTYFPRIFMGIDGALESAAGLRSQGARDFVAAYPTPFAGTMSVPFDTARVDTGSVASGAKWLTLPQAGGLDANSAPGLPRIDGWIMAANFGCQENPTGYFRVEDPLQPIAAPIYTYHGVRTGVTMQGGVSPREGLVCGVRVQAHDLGGTGSPLSVVQNPNGALGRMVHIGFPLYFLKDAAAVAVLKAAFTYVDGSPTLP
jgi:hypothetical protein